LVDAGSIDTMDIVTHLDRPLTKSEMGALQALVEHGTKLQKKGFTPKEKEPTKSMEEA
jgi:hypothetical protein